MKKLIVLAVVAFAAGASVPAFAGGCGGGGCGAAKNADGFACENPCPLAQDANNLRSFGREALGVSTSLRASMSSMVQRNLTRV
jgi:hypothetical protein